MGQRFTPHQFALYKRIDEILWFDWDPLGVNTVEAARDEYYRYIFPVMEMVSQGASKYKVANYIYRCEVNDMKLSGDKSRAELIASLICEARDIVFMDKHNQNQIGITI